MNKHEKPWTKLYSSRTGTVFPYPESFVDRLLRSRTPEPGLKNQDISGQRVLDLSCGHGRNLHLLESLGSDLYATEINEEIVSDLRARISGIEFRVGKAHQLPFEKEFFDGIVACNSCYYLDDGVIFQDSLKEIRRILRPSGWFLGSIPATDHSILRGAEKLEDSSFLVQNDQLNLRNGYRLQAAKSQDDVKEMLAPHFTDFKIGHTAELFQGFNRSLFYFTCYCKL